MKIRTNIAKYLTLVAVSFGLSAESKAAITNGLVVHLTFDNDYNDSSGNGNNGSPQGTPGPSFVPGKIGSGAVSVTTKKDSSEIDYVTLGYPSQLKFGDSTSFSVSFWANYTNQVDDPPFISNKDWNSSNNRGWGIFTQGGGNYRINVTGTGGTKMSDSSTPVIRDGTWHQIAVTFSRSGSVNSYVDGKLATTDPLQTTGTIDTDDLSLAVNIGQDGTGAYTDGGGAEMVGVKMDDLGIWNRVLSPSEVSAIYSFGNNGTNLAGVPLVDPFVSSTTPAALAVDVLPSTVISATISDGLNKVATNTILLSLNGTAVTPSIIKNGVDTTVQFIPASRLPATSANTVTLIFANNATPATSFTNTWAFTVINYHVIPPGAGTPPGSANTPGFKARSVQARMDANLPNSIARQEAQLAGTLTDPQTGQPYVNHATPGPNSDGSYNIDVVNFNLGGGDAGGIPGDVDFPGVPGDEFSGLNFAVEVLAYVELNAGYHRFGVNSDDGFLVRAGADARDATSQVLGFYESGRAAGDTVFDFVVQSNGVYSFRLSYEQGGGQASLEFYSVDLTTGQKTLINDLTSPNPIKAYRVRPGSGTLPFVSVLVPGSPVNVGPDVVISATIQNATTQVVTNTIKLYFDSGQVQPTIQPANGTNTLVQYDPPGILSSLSTHDVQLVFADNGSPATTKTNEFQFTVISYVNKILPAPIYFENFEGVTEGGLPPGWISTNNTDSINPGIDLGDPKSDAYLGWLVITRDQVFENSTNSFAVWEVDDPDGRVTTIAPGQVVNGVVLTAANLMENKFVYAESDERGGNQVQMLFSPNYDLTGKSNLWVSFHSSYVQNQDDIAALEYSIDGGTNWLPVLYMLDGPDVIRFPDGTVDAVTTLTRVDPDNTAFGTSYGAYIAAPISQALAPYISRRVNDDKAESHRVELFPLPLADNKPKVMFRFAQAGTASWYWGIDDFGLYSIPSVSSQPIQLTSARSGTDLVINWTGGQGPFTLQRRADLNASTAWQDVGGAISGNTVTVNNAFTGLQGYYRIKGQ